MSFDAGWLDLRAPADAAARAPDLLARARTYLTATPGALALDLGAGTGATARAFATPGVRWRLLDADPDLLAHAAQRTPAAETVVMDLSRLDALPLAGVRLVTASALLDLASAQWLDTLARRLAQANLAVYAALTYDGSLEWTPAHPDDAAVAAGFNRHQRGEKGLGGPALGPDAAPCLAAALTRLGFRVSVAASPWRLHPGALLDALTDGIAAAAAETGVETRAWRQARAATVFASVGQVDLFATPPAASAQSKTTSVSSP
ncbi:MAG: class I SAM-dependent methyltransferase [Amaricoccus sp.]|uniref:class I SAM-dependent methyltransferase n=1 Tax=Amaricoccus sp. TaxID=1872485 RepID=UPI0039E4F1FB